MSGDIPTENILVHYEYAAKREEHAGVNHSWRILRDGRFQKRQNPNPSQRPQSVQSPFWYCTEWTQTKVLSDSELEAVAHLISTNPPPRGVYPAPRPSPRGDRARLTVAVTNGFHVVEVEDRCTNQHEVWMNHLVLLLMPELAKLKALKQGSQ